MLSKALSDTNNINETPPIPTYLPHLISGYYEDKHKKQYSKEETKTPLGPQTIKQESPLLSKTDNFIGLENLLTQRDKIYCKQGISLNIMVCGKTGTGKTSLLERLFGINLSQDRTTTELLEDKNSSLRLKQHWVEMTHESVKILLGVTEVEGFGLGINNSFQWVPLMKLIHGKKTQYERQRSQPMRIFGHDDRIHSCLFLLDPHSEISRLEVITMQQISQLTNLIPVVSKVDILDFPNDKQFLQDRLWTKFKLYGIEPVKYMKGTELKNPFFFCGQFNSPEVDDMALLQDFVIDSGMIDIIDGTEKQFWKERDEIVSKRICGMKRQYDAIKIQKLRPKEEKDHEISIHNNFDWSWWDEPFLKEQIAIKIRYLQLVNRQSKKFDEWIVALLSKGAVANKILGHIAEKLKILRVECKELEEQLVTIHNEQERKRGRGRSLTNSSGMTLYSDSRHDAVSNNDSHHTNLWRQ